MGGVKGFDSGVAGPARLTIGWVEERCGVEQIEPLRSGEATEEPVQVLRSDDEPLELRDVVRSRVRKCSECLEFSVPVSLIIGDIPPSKGLVEPC